MTAHMMYDSSGNALELIRSSYTGQVTRIKIHAPHGRSHSFKLANSGMRERLAALLTSTEPVEPELNSLDTTGLPANDR